MRSNQDVSQSTMQIYCVVVVSCDLGSRSILSQRCRCTSVGVQSGPTIAKCERGSIPIAKATGELTTPPCSPESAGSTPITDVLAPDASICHCEKERHEHSPKGVPQLELVVSQPPANVLVYCWPAEELYHMFAPNVEFRMLSPSSQVHN